MASLTIEDMEFCNRLGLEIDWDENEHQLQHIRWPILTHKGFLCKSEYLEGADDIKSTSDCQDCIKQLKLLKQSENTNSELFDVISKLSATVNSLQEIELAAIDYVWSLDNPELAKRYESDGTYSFLSRLRNALEAEQKRYEKLWDAQKLVIIHINFHTQVICVRSVRYLAKIVEKVVLALIVKRHRVIVFVI